MRVVIGIALRKQLEGINGLQKSGVKDYSGKGIDGFEWWET